MSLETTRAIGIEKPYDVKVPVPPINAGTTEQIMKALRAWAKTHADQ